MLKSLVNDLLYMIIRQRIIHDLGLSSEFDQSGKPECFQLVRDRRFGDAHGYIPAGNLPLEDIVFNYRAYGLPCFETIRRARQRVQSLFPEYSRNPQKEEQSGSISIVINIS